MSKNLKVIGWCGAVLALGAVLWFVQSPHNPKRDTSTGLEAPGAVSDNPTSSALAGVIASPGSLAPGGLVPIPGGTAASSLSAKSSGSLPEAPRFIPQAIASQVAALGLNRQLSGVQKVSYAGRDRTVLGTKEVANSNGLQTVLLVRDEQSGQIDYWQSGLRIELQPGNDHEAFVRENPLLKRRFVSTSYAEVLVDAADIAGVHTVLSTDPRVQSVRFISLQPSVKAR